MDVLLKAKCIEQAVVNQVKEFLSANQLKLPAVAAKHKLGSTPNGGSTAKKMKKVMQILTIWGYLLGL